MNIKIHGNILNNISIELPKNVHSTAANEAEVENNFEEYLKDIGYGSAGEYFTKRTAKDANDKFPSKTGAGNGFPDYIFYENEHSKRIIAIGDVKAPSPKGIDTSINGLRECQDIYLKEYNKKHPNNKINICFGYDGFNFIIKYLNKCNEWVDITIDDEPICGLPTLELLNLISKYGNTLTTQIEKNVSHAELEPYFAQCDSIFRSGKTSLSAIDKAAEISIFIFLKIFSDDGLDKEYVMQNGMTVWQTIENGNVNSVNKIFKEFLNSQYENVFPAELIKVDSQMTRELAKIINSMFDKCKIDRMTDVKGNALEYYQKDSKDKKIGEFFTPRHLIELIIFLTSPKIEFCKDNDGEYIVDSNGNRTIKRIDKIYDPACGSGGFLISSFLSYIEKNQKYGVTNNDLKKNVVFGNELKDTTVMLTKLNMILLGDGHNHISNENALGYDKDEVYERVKDENGKYVEIDEEDVEWKNIIIGDKNCNLPFDKKTNERVVEILPKVTFYLARYDAKGKLIKKKNQNGEYVKLSENDVAFDAKSNAYDKISKEPVLCVGKLTKKYYKAKVKLQKDGIRPFVKYINVNPVNERVKEYHKKYFGNFDIVMANHPYALEEPKSPDELFIRHMIESVRQKGKIACIVGETLLFHDSYSSFREWMLENITIEGIISLPQGVFNPYTDVKTSILLLTKEKPNSNHKTWLVDLQNDGFDLNLRRKPIKQNDIPKIKNLWQRWGGYEIEDETGRTIIKSFHKEEVGFAEFHKLHYENWCVKRYNTPLMSLGTKYPLRSIKELLIRYKEPITVWDNELYKQVTIQMHNKGVILREEQYGVEIGTKKQFKIKKGQFLISKIDARNGAYGVISSELDGAIITGNFWAYDINKKLVLPEYLTYLMRHEFFIKMCNVCSYGATNRWYLDEETFNNFKIPIPSLDEQKEFLKKIKVHTNKIKKAEMQIKKEEDGIMSIIDGIVGVE